MSKNSLEFEGPRQKLKRAKHHIEDFVSRAEQFYGESQPKFFIKDNPYTNMRALCIDIDTSVPDEFPLIIGDAVHNLRSALDHLTYGIVLPLNPERPWDVQFPFCRQAGAFEGALSHRQIKLASEEIVEKFRKLQPYPGGNNSLYELHELDVTDKHQLILTVRSLIAFDSLNVREDVEQSAPADLIIRNVAYTNIDKDNRIAMWRVIPGTPVISVGSNQGKPIDVLTQIMFRDGQPFAGENVAACLRELYILVESAIDSIMA